MCTYISFIQSDQTPGSLAGVSLVHWLTPFKLELCLNQKPATFKSMWIKKFPVVFNILRQKISIICIILRTHEVLAADVLVSNVSRCCKYDNSQFQTIIIRNSFILTPRNHCFWKQQKPIFSIFLYIPCSSRCQTEVDLDSSPKKNRKSRGWAFCIYLYVFVCFRYLKISNMTNFWFSH